MPLSSLAAFLVLNYASRYVIVPSGVKSQELCPNLKHRVSRSAQARDGISNTDTDVMW